MKECEEEGRRVEDGALHGKLMQYGKVTLKGLLETMEKGRGEK